MQTKLNLSLVYKTSSRATLRSPILGKKKIRVEMEAFIINTIQVEGKKKSDGTRWIHS